MKATADPQIAARRIDVRGVVQGVGFRPYVYRLAQIHALNGWVINGDAGVRIHVEGPADALDAFAADLAAAPPPAARVTDIEIATAEACAFRSFQICDSESNSRPTVRIAPDLPVCAACLTEMFDPANRRYLYPYINCTNCGPRLSIVRGLPYDRAQTTMAGWPMCEACAAEYHDPNDRRFHAQPVACAKCGPRYYLVPLAPAAAATTDAIDPIHAAVQLLREGQIIGIKGIGGYHLACNAAHEASVAMLRNRKFRKDQAFALMVRDLPKAEQTVALDPGAVRLLTSPARPIVLAPARVALPGVAPDSSDLGVMLPYTPLHHLLFAAGAPDCLVMTSGNRSSDPIAYDDADAISRLRDLANALLVGERPIARRVDDSVVRANAAGPMPVRRSRGMAPGAAAVFPTKQPILALGGDLKNAVTLVVDGQAYVSQHIGDLSNADSRRAFEGAVHDLLSMYDVRFDDLLVVHDAHPQYVSAAHAATLPAKRRIAVQHHRAHVASVLAERGELDRIVLGVAFDGTGYGDDGTIWGGEFFVGSVLGGFERIAHLHAAQLPGGDAAARNPVQAAAGLIAELADAPDLSGPPFNFGDRYRQARALVRSRLRAFTTTSAGRLFDTVAALAGFTRPITFEGQAAMWLEQLARSSADDEPILRAPFTGSEIDWRPILAGVIAARQAGAKPSAVARAFHRALGASIAQAIDDLANRFSVAAVVLSGGVFQNALLLDDVRLACGSGAELLTNREVPANDGGLSLGQAALALAGLL